MNQLFFLDAGTVETDTAAEALPAPDESNDDEEEVPALWYDSDDDRLTISLAGQAKLRKLRTTASEDLINGKEYVKRLRRLYQQLHPVPGWVAADQNKKPADSSDAMDTDEEDVSTQPLARLLQGAMDLTKKIEDNPKRRKLRQEVVDIQRLKDVGASSQPSSIDSLSFHPQYPILLSSGPASTLFLHHISPQASPLLTSVHIRYTPIHTSAFLGPAGDKIFASGRRRYFHIWDLDTGKVDKVNGSADRKEEQKSMERFKLSPCGRYMGLVGSSRKGGGVINVLNSGTAQWIAQVRVDSRGGVADFAWWSDGEGMTVVGKNGEVSEWDGRERRVLARWIDEGAVGTTVLSLGGGAVKGPKQLGDDRWVAVGSSSGVVNVYDRREWKHGSIPRHPKPVRALDHLTTPVSHLVFSPDGQLLVIASRWKKDALKLGMYRKEASHLMLLHVC